MKIIIQDMENNILKKINNIGKNEFFTYSPKAKSVKYNEDFKIFEKLNHDLIILRYCKNSKDFIVEYMSENYIDLINSINVYDFNLNYKMIIGRYFSKMFPFIKDNNLLKVFIDVAENKESFEFREVKYIDNILITIYRHKLFFLEGCLFHLSHAEQDLDLLYFAGEEFFDNSERPYILIEGNIILKVNKMFLNTFNVEESEILGFYNFENLDFTDISQEDAEQVLNNLLNRKSFFETFEFSIVGDEDKRRWIRAFASPSSFNHTPAVKIFFKEFTEEKERELQEYLLKDTLNLVQYGADISGFYKKSEFEMPFKDNSLFDEEQFYEENILNNNAKNLEKKQLLTDDGMNVNNSNTFEFDVLDHLDNSTVYSRGIYNILDLSLNDLDKDIGYDNSIDGFNEKINEHRAFNNIKFSQYISEADKEYFKSELKNFSKNYNRINANFRIISAKNREKYLNFIIEGEFDENGRVLDYIGFLKDNTDRILNENNLKENLINLENLLYDISRINEKLEITQKSEERLLNDFHIFINDLLYLLLQIMDRDLKLGHAKKVIFENFQRIINVLLRIYQYISDDFNLLNININECILDALNYLSSNESINLNYNVDLENTYMNIGTLTFLGIVLYEFVCNIFSDEEISICLSEKNNHAHLTIERKKDSENETISNICLVKEIISSLDFELSKSEEGNQYDISIPIVNDYIVSLNN